MISRSRLWLGTSVTYTSNVAALIEVEFRHEIVGTAVRVGSAVKSRIKIGDRVGVGAQVSSCYHCKACTTNNENYCPEAVSTYVRKNCDCDRG